MLEQYCCRRLRYVTHSFCAPRHHARGLCNTEALDARHSLFLLGARGNYSITTRTHSLISLCAPYIGAHSLSVSSRSLSFLSARDSSGFSLCAFCASALLSLLCSSFCAALLLLCSRLGSSLSFTAVQSLPRLHLSLVESAFYTADPNKHKMQYTSIKRQNKNSNCI